MAVVQIGVPAVITPKHNQLPIDLGPIQLVAVSSLKYPKAFKVYSSATVRRAARFIEALGLRVPVLIDRDRNIICGEIWTLAHKHLGSPEISVLVADGLTKDQLDAYRIGMQRIPELGEWDNGALGELFQDWTGRDMGFDIELTGFALPEIDILIQAAKTDTSDVSDDALESSDVGPLITKPGDLWQCGPHRILCGSSIVRSSFDTLMINDRAAAVITDPPYNVAIDGHVGGKGNIHHQEFAMASGEMNNGEFVDFLQSFMGHAAAFSREGSLHYVFMDWRHAAELMQAGSSVYQELKNVAVWVKSNGGMGSLYRSRHELVFVYKYGRATHRNNVQLGRFGRNRSNVWEYPGANGFDGRKTEEGHLLALHPTVKPVQMLADIMLDCTARADIILDPFLGSGSSLIAAERVGRQLRAIEIDPRYVDLTIRRWQRHTGDQAVHAVTGVRFDQPTSNMAS
jgi:DNA modification methylase